MANSSNDKYAPEPWGAEGAGVSPSRGAPEGDALAAVAQYLADMSGQLESMARAAKLELVAYLLSMARAEADSLARTWPGESDAKPR